MMSPTASIRSEKRSADIREYRIFLSGSSLAVIKPATAPEIRRAAKAPIFAKRSGCGVADIIKLEITDKRMNDAADIPTPIAREEGIPPCGRNFLFAIL